MTNRTIVIESSTSNRKPADGFAHAIRIRRSCCRHIWDRTLWPALAVIWKSLERIGLDLRLDRGGCFGWVAPRV